YRPADVGVLCAVVEGDGDFPRDIAGIDGGAALHSRNAAYVHGGTVCGDGNFGVHAAIVEGDLVFARYAAREHRTSVCFEHESRSVIGGAAGNFAEIGSARKRARIHSGGPVCRDAASDFAFLDGKSLQVADESA